MGELLTSCMDICMLSLRVSLMYQYLYPISFMCTLIHYTSCVDTGVLSLVGVGCVHTYHPRVDMHIQYIYGHCIDTKYPATFLVRHCGHIGGLRTSQLMAICSLSVMG